MTLSIGTITTDEEGRGMRELVCRKRATFLWCDDTVLMRPVLGTPVMRMLMMVRPVFFQARARVQQVVDALAPHGRKRATFL